MYLNKSLIIGNLTRDPEIKALPTGMKVCSFTVATNRSWKDKDGVKKEEADFHNIVVFGKQAESCGEYLRKGSQVLVEGRLQTRSWDGKDGEKKYRTEIIAESVKFGKKASEKNEAAEEAPPEAPQEETPRVRSQAEIDEGINIDNIPF